MKVQCREYVKPTYADEVDYICMSSFPCVDHFRFGFPLSKACEDGIVEIDWITYITKKEYFKRIIE